MANPENSGVVQEALGVIVMNCVLGGDAPKTTCHGWVGNKQIWTRNRYKAIEAGLFTIAIRKIKPNAIIIGECYNLQYTHRM